MASGYFHRVTRETPTRLWINNPTGQEVEKAIPAGAISVTTNPSYCSRLLRDEPEYIRRIIDEVIKEIEDDNIAAERIYQKAALRIIKRFLPIFEESRHKCGYVTIQGAPGEDEDPEKIVHAALCSQHLGKNFMAKIPVTEAGIQAIEDLIPRDIPICATEVFSISQAVYVCETYKRISKKSGRHPPFYVTHITGIFDEYLANITKRDSIQIASQVLGQAGCIVARKEYRMIKERGYETTMLGGGARGPQHFTELIGGDAHITINWNTAQHLIEADGPVVSRMDVESPQYVIDELSEKLPDFKKAFLEDELSIKEFKDYGPVVYFRDMFLKGYNHLLDKIAARRG